MCLAECAPFQKQPTLRHCSTLAWLACLASHARRVALKAQAWKGVLMPADWTTSYCGIDPLCAKQGTQARVRTPWCTGNGSTVAISARVCPVWRGLDVPLAYHRMWKQQSNSRTESCRAALQRLVLMENLDLLPESHPRWNLDRERSKHVAGDGSQKKKKKLSSSKVTHHTPY